MPSLPAIQAAFNAANIAEPPKDYKLSKDAKQLATVIGEMWHFKKDDRDLSEMTSSQIEAYERWKVMS
jgi:hypothetical protein